MAKTMGFLAMDLIIDWSTAPFTERPKKTSAPFMAWAKVRALVLIAWADFHWFMRSSRP